MLTVCWAESRQPSGAVFAFRLPAQPAGAGPHLPQPAALIARLIEAQTKGYCAKNIAAAVLELG